MIYRLRLARWFADETKRERLADILSSEVLAEAIDIVTAAQREDYNAIRGTASEAFLARRDIESGSIAQFINSLATLSAPPAKPLPHLEEWSHIDHTESPNPTP